MFISISIKNFKSFKDTQHFSLESSTYNGKLHNTFNIDKSLDDCDSNNRLLKTAAIYGANSSGKTSILEVINLVSEFIANKYDYDNPLSFQLYQNYHPFIFDTSDVNEIDKPTEILIEFAIKQTGYSPIKYVYHLEYNRDKVIKESLQTGKDFDVILFERIDNGEEYHNVRINHKYRNVHKTQSVFRLTFDEYSDQNKELVNIREYFSKVGMLYSNTYIVPSESDNNFISSSVVNLMKYFDNSIHNIKYVRKHFIKSSKEKYKLQIEYKHNDIIHTFDYSEHSKNFKRLLSLCYCVIDSLDKGRLLLIDDIDSGIHSKVLIELLKIFTSELTNENNSQLIFTTQDANLIDHHYTRADQIWFTEKHNHQSSLFSAQDFEGIREDIPFDKWYLAGKFGAIPQFNYEITLRDVFYSK